MNSFSSQSIQSLQELTTREVKLLEQADVVSFYALLPLAGKGAVKVEKGIAYEMFAAILIVDGRTVAYNFAWNTATGTIDYCIPVDEDETAGA